MTTEKIDGCPSPTGQVYFDGKCVSHKSTPVAEASVGVVRPAS